ncbi:hypothetical protein PTSG_02432 [Salpingoeca rosetta]|uniref:UBA domain-containing protein n=1 Tax=Salpingoeca rosetta (strain ATCC 50818 / BSB-021) TaxID=946362 RepID=F2U269_SALR5|nr:uncharacterized protein PTSG_02432 [Salpingoeca rosetta]EGD81721.1 hypothetical protein PTSG_02432 [Salpingoeca rosetta]|eukprot:XP_004996925.1 hypothetical protein PTSG_02432 [Salpingoeca rosetta]
MTPPTAVFLNEEDDLTTPLRHQEEWRPRHQQQQPGRVRQTSGAGARYAEQLLGAGGRQRRQRPPTQDNIAALVAMGFPQESARWALTQTGNDLQAAVELLTTAAR